MNAPATLTAVRPDAAARAAPDLLAWEWIRTLVAFDTTSRESNLALIERVRRHFAAHGVACTLTFDDEQRKANLFATLPGFDTLGEFDIASLGAACNESSEHGKVSFGTEASLYHYAAKPAIISGPGHIAQAHQPNEWVTVDQLARCEAFMRRLADRVCVT